MPSRDFSNVEAAIAAGRRYGVMAADPAWSYHARGPGGYAKSPQTHYACMEIDEICALPVAQLAAPSCALFLWVPGFALDQGMAAMKAWGFRYLTLGTWCKTSSTGRRWAFGTGHVMRGASEVFLVGARGTPRRRGAVPRGLIGAETPADMINAAPVSDEAIVRAFDGFSAVDAVREHSRKPDSLYKAAEAMFHGPYVELFSREARGPLWDAIGDQAGLFDAPDGAGARRLS
jgi:N6-adenosine-specific RNA methylase IME4